MCKTLVDTSFFMVNSWLKKSHSQINLQQDQKSLDTLIECKNCLQTEDRRLLYQLGNREFSLGNFEKSLEYFEKYQKLCPTCQRTQIQIAQIQYRLGNLEEAEKLAEKFLQDANLHWTLRVVVLSLMVQIQHQQQNFQKMNEFANQILEREPNDSFIKIYLADTRMNNSETREDAIKSLKKLRLQIYRERIQFSKQTFTDLVGIISKYNEILLQD